jgi:hypothetical protein
VTLKVTGLTAAIRLNEMIARNPKLERMMENVVKDTVALIRRYCPVSTGNLLESIRYQKISRREFKIIIDVPYAVYNEYGTKYMEVGTEVSPKGVVSESGKASYRPFIRPALWEMSKMFPFHIKQIFMELRSSGSL